MSATSSATAVVSLAGAAAAVGVRFSGAGGVVASSGGGAGEFGAGALLFAGCCAKATGIAGTAARAFTKRLRFIEREERNVRTYLIMY
jgi:hypothetical protein